MAYSYVEYTGNGNTTSYTLSFTGQDKGYFRDSDIEVTVDGATAPFTLLSSNSLELDNAPALGSKVIIRRVMPKSEPYADFQRGNNFGQEVLNNSFLQLLYVVHELLDGWFPEGFTVRELVEYEAGLLSTMPDPRNPDSVVTFGTGDERYLKRLNGVAQSLTTIGRMAVRDAQSEDEAASYGQLMSSEESLAAQIDSIQGQLSETSPLEASAFSPISWHSQSIDNSVTIPPNSNAWSFGPTVTVSHGVIVTMSEGSFYTLANGEATSVEISGFDEGEL